jgi:steroid delta-isomerase-like uncharacterized protein
MISEREELNRNKDLIYRFTEDCWNCGDLAKVPEMVADDCQHHDPLFPHMAQGAESVQRLIVRIRRAFPDLKFTITGTASRKDKVEVQWSASATQAAEFLGISAREQHASITGKSTYRIKRGKIVEHWAEWDVMSLMQQLGSPAIGQQVEPWAKAG